jgi:hypothetical protein
MNAAITRAHFPPDRVEDLEAHMKETLVPYHKDLKKQGLQNFLALVNRETGEGIGIAIWEDEGQIREVEGRHPREAPRAIRSPEEAPTEYTKRRATYVKDVGGSIDAADWYEVIGQV